MIDIAKPQYTRSGYLIENLVVLKSGFGGHVQGIERRWDENGRVRFAPDDLDIQTSSSDPDRPTPLFTLGSKCPLYLRTVDGREAVIHGQEPEEPFRIHGTVGGVAAMWSSVGASCNSDDPGWNLIFPSKPQAPPVSIDRIWQQAHREEVVRQRFDTGTWRVTELCQVVANEPVFELPLAHIDLGSYNLDGDPGGLIAFARHMKHVMEADLSVPIILDEWGGILDGRHRVVKALIENRPYVLAKRVPAGTRPTERP